MMQSKEEFWTRKRRSLFLLATVAVVVTIDQLSKMYATAHWAGPPRRPFSFFGDLFRISYDQNEGAFLGLFGNLPSEVRFWILVVANGLMLTGLTIYLIASSRMLRITFLPLSLIVAGGLGNMIDRVRFGWVIDFMNVGVGGLRTGIFNVADMAITAGFILLMPIVLRSETCPTQASTSKPLNAS